MILIAGASWLFINIPHGRVSNCDCQSAEFCTVVFVNDEIVKQAQNSEGKIQISQDGVTLAASFGELEG